MNSPPQVGGRAGLTGRSPEAPPSTWCLTSGGPQGTARSPVAGRSRVRLHTLRALGQNVLRRLNDLSGQTHTRSHARSLGPTPCHLSSGRSWRAEWPGAGPGRRAGWVRAQVTGGQHVLGAQQAPLCLGCALAGMPQNSWEGVQCRLRGIWGSGDRGRMGLPSAGFSWGTMAFMEGGLLLMEFLKLCRLSLPGGTCTHSTLQAAPQPWEGEVGREWGTSKYTISYPLPPLSQQTWGPGSPAAPGFPFGLRRESRS